MTTQKSTKKEYPNYLFPMMVGDASETEEQYWERHTKFKSLPDDMQEILASEETAEVVAQIERKYKLNQEQVKVVARSVRLYYFGELAADDFAGYLEKMIPVQQRIAESITQIIMRKIINNESLLPRETTTVKDALEKYEDLRNQMITTRDIIVTGTQSLARPTIGHWLTDYHLSIGQGEHTSIQRGNYLFHNKNAEQLTDSERQRLAIVLKSWDENIPLVVDVAKQKIIFPAQKVSAVTTRTTGEVVKQNAVEAMTLKQTEAVSKDNNTHLKTNQSNLRNNLSDNKVLTEVVMDKVSKKIKEVQKVEAVKSISNKTSQAQPINKSSTPNLDRLIAEKKAALSKVVKNLDPVSLRNQHLAKLSKVGGVGGDNLTTAQNAPGKLPIVKDNSITKQQKQPSGFVSFSSKQKLPTEER